MLSCIATSPYFSINYIPTALWNSVFGECSVAYKQGSAASGLYLGVIRDLYLPNDVFVTNRNAYRDALRSVKIYGCVTSNNLVWNRITNKNRRCKTIPIFVVEFSRR